MIVPEDDVGVIPVSVATFTHVPHPPTMRTVRPRLGYVSDAKLVRGRDDLQRGGLLSWSQFRLRYSQIHERTRMDVGVEKIVRSPAKVLVLIERLDQRCFACRVS